MRWLGGVTVAMAVWAAAANAQEAIQHGRIESRPDATPAAAIAALAQQPVPFWLAWQAPMIDGQASPCSTWSDDVNVVRGERLGAAAERAPAIDPPPARGIRLDAGTRITVLTRLVAGRAERIRAVGDDCPIDAAGQTVYWLPQVTPAASVAFLEAFTARPTAIAENRRLAMSAIAALSYHADASAEAALDRLTQPSADAGVRRQAARALARTRGAHGLERVSAMIENERATAARQALVGALAESPLPGAAERLLAIARTDPEPAVRGEAAYWHVRRAGAAGIDAARSLLAAEADDAVARRIVAGIATAPAAAAVPALLDFARSTARPAVRKEAVRALGRTGDPQAIAYLEELVRN